MENLPELSPAPLARIAYILKFEQVSLVERVSTFLILVYLTRKLLDANIGYRLTACIHTSSFAITTQA